MSKSYYMLTESTSLFNVLDECVYMPFYLGNVLKYVIRAPRKHTYQIDDLTKALEYLEHARTSDGRVRHDTLKALIKMRAIIKASDCLLEQWQKTAAVQILAQDYTGAAETIQNQLRAVINTETHV